MGTPRSHSKIQPILPLSGSFALFFMAPTFRVPQCGRACEIRETSGPAPSRDASRAMQKLIFETCDASHAAFCEPVVLEGLHGSPMGKEQAVEPFREAHEVTARAENEEATPCFSFGR